MPAFVPAGVWLGLLLGLMVPFRVVGMRFTFSMPVPCDCGRKRSAFTGFGREVLPLPIGTVHVVQLMADLVQ